MKPDFEAIKGRLEAATPGPWHVQEELEDFQEGEPPFTVWRGIYSAAGGLNKGDEYEVFEIADADFIAHAPADISALLGWVEKLEAVREAVNQYLEVYESSGEYHDWRIRELVALDKLKATLAVCEEVIDD